MSDKVFDLPDVGEGLTEAEMVSWKVAVGDQVSLNQIVCEIETAKSLVELPSPFAGTVLELLAQEGETVPVGQPIMKVAVEGDVDDHDINGAPEPLGEEVTDSASDTEASIQHENDGSGSVLVGYGTGGTARSRRRRGGEPVLPASTSAIPVAEAGPIIAKPPIRRLAKELDVNLATISGTGIAGEITRDDVIRQASQASVFRNIQTPEAPQAREERYPVKGVRKSIAQAMVQSAFTAPHVSVFVDVDATRTMEFVKRLKASPEFAGVKVSPLLVMAKAIMWAVRRNPMVNSTWTDEEIIVHNFVNLGLAAATPRGLIVPNIKEAHDMSLLELAQAIEQLTITARDGRTSMEEMTGGTITITNIGVFGMDTGTPIINPGEVACIALGTIKQKPWVVDGQVLPRYVTTVGGSFDHRVVDGDVVSRFTADVASVLEEPALLLD
jgi:2-oxoisovalerate dehydrogenase E2 component (dihydrolipoyl transacylase)